MAIHTKRTEAGQGGKLGHSNMTHWDYTEQIKDESRKRRRQQSKIEVKEQLESEWNGKKA